LYNDDVKSLPVSKARESLAEVLGQLDDGPVEITRHGEPLGYIVSPTMFSHIPHPTVIHRFTTAGVEPATSGIDELLAVEPLPDSDNFPALSDVLEELREDRL
jgi:prevent-host-death family protein